MRGSGRVPKVASARQRSDKTAFSVLMAATRVLGNMYAGAEPVFVCSAPTAVVRPLTHRETWAL